MEKNCCWNTVKKNGSLKLGQGMAGSALKKWGDTKSDKAHWKNEELILK